MSQVIEKLRIKKHPQNSINAFKGVILHGQYDKVKYRRLHKTKSPFIAPVTKFQTTISLEQSIEL